MISLLLFYWPLLLGLYIFQGILGVIGFEWAWKKSERIRKGQPEMYDEFPAFKRIDSHLWSRWNHYPGCFLFMLPRAVFTMGTFGLGGLGFKLLFIGESTDVPLSGWKRTAYKWLLWTLTPLTVLGFGYVIDSVESEADYSKYLGSNWRENRFKGKRVSVIISNHGTFLDILA